MTLTERRARRDTTVIRFLLEEFTDVADQRPDDEPEASASTLQTQAARFFLPGPKKSAFSPQQLALRAMPSAAFHALRVEVRDWLHAVVMRGPVGTARVLRGPLTLSVASIPGRRVESARKAGLSGPLFEMPDARELFWLYLFLTIIRIGVEQIKVCHAPRSQRDASHESRECGRLYLRRGKAKRFCSDTCRARVATQRARSK
jgi:hypothetical protein